VERELAGMLSCDYNGWTDAPEDEREELERCFSDVVLPDTGVGRPSGRNGFSAAAVLTTEERVHEAFECGGTHEVRFAALDQDLAGSVDRR
jgi:hypothetical protein